MATAYWTLKYSEPLVVVPGMGLFYRGDRCRIRTPLSRGLHRILESAIGDRGDFIIESVGFDRVILEIDDVDTGSWTSVHCTMRWDQFMAALIVVQLRVQLRVSRPMRKAVREFQESGYGRKLPADVVMLISGMCFERTFNAQIPRVETISYRR